MDKRIIYVTILALVLIGLWAGFYFKENLLGIYNSAADKLEQFQKTDFGNSIHDVAQEMLNPGPLNIGGKQNNTVLANSKITAETNIQRYNNGQLPPLLENAKLNAAAKAKAQDILDNQYFEHASPSGIDPGQLVKKYGYDYIVSGENLILGNFKNEAEVVQNWMNSPGHRANILNTRFADIGVAFVRGEYKGEMVWVGVQEFGLPLSACDSPDVKIKTQIDSDKKQLDNLSSQIDSKRAEANNTNPNSPEYQQKVDEYNALVNKYNQLAQNTKDLIAKYNTQIDAFNQCIVGQE